MLLVKQERIIAINSIQWSQSFLGEPVLIINQETPRLSSRMHPLAACIHGEYVSVCIKWQTASWHFCLKSPRICSQELSMVIEGGTPCAGKAMRGFCGLPLCVALERHNTIQRMWCILGHICCLLQRQSGQTSYQRITDAAVVYNVTFCHWLGIYRPWLGLSTRRHPVA